MPVPDNEFLFAFPERADRDDDAHNAEVRALWADFNERVHKRVPVRLNTNPRMLMLDPAYNVNGIDYATYMTDPDVMARTILEFQYWHRSFLPGDHEYGLPERWTLAIDFENHYDAVWFGCPIHYRAGQVPDTTPILTDDRKNMLFDRGIPEPFAGEWAERALAYIDHYKERCEAGWTFLDRPVDPPSYAPFIGCDGIFTVAASLRGPQGLAMDLLADSDYANQLLDYVCDALIARMTAWRERLGMPVRQSGFWSADDTIEILSVDQYREFVLPRHRRFYDAFGTSEGRGMHICGDVQRFFLPLHQELGIQAFDTGFPVNFSQFRRELGPDVLISGGPRITYFLEDTPDPIIDEVVRIMNSGVLEGGRFILQEGNNLPPRARLHVCEEFYKTGRLLGRL